MTSDLFAQTRIGEHSAIGVDNSAPLWATISLLPVLHRLILGLLSFFNSFFFSISRLAYFKARFIYPGIHLYHSWEHHSGWGVLCIDHGRRVFKHYFLFLVVCRGLADGTVSARFPRLRKGLQ